MITVRTYGVPGSFNEANPESSTRHIGKITLHVEADSPPCRSPESSVGAATLRWHATAGLSPTRTPAPGRRAPRLAPRPRRPRRAGPAPGEVRRQGQGPAAPAAQAEAVHHVGFRAGLGRRVLADLGLEVRDRVRVAAAGARAGARVPAASRGHPRVRADVHPVPRCAGRDEGAAQGRRRRGPGRPGRAGVRVARGARAARDLRADRRRAVPGARLHRVLPEPVQPAARAAARRRTGHGGACRRGCGSSASRC